MTRNLVCLGLLHDPVLLEPLHVFVCLFITASNMTVANTQSLTIKQSVSL